tara:strand:- start:254 stop:463 length:210 start_codon:yes stop_codon:yes gene_type:complete
MPKVVRTQDWEKVFRDEVSDLAKGWNVREKRGNMNALSFYEHMDRQMSFDEMKAIFRDIQFTHKTFGWD